MLPTTSIVIARLDRAIQYSAADVITRDVAAYWMPACAGMTAEDLAGSVPYRFPPYFFPPFDVWECEWL
ncbi:hypothetical protein LQG66_32785 [Bradyrhizobium ontarionense]|uniref:Uncharacterized protein n=1 Tax=Bradyrhizobium ontarionense TaxID=2898149 RepID=A0ABY3R9M9_9BRAD|nr:hypothetical protein [Bradyrhizobium sp. A19]UFZ03919.1 hypothetical protein LQG66_32785 [Bradyrhizobium sp. A19]